MFDDIDNIKNYFVYQYHFLDDLSAILEPKDVNSYFGFERENSKIIENSVEEVKKLFLKNGWEGDGDIGVIWVPPFIDIGYQEDTWGTYLWHVKQSNNGTSFIGSPIKLNIRRLKDQNEFVSPNDHRNMEPINIIQTNVDGFLERLEEDKKSFDDGHGKLKNETDKVSKDILEKFLGYTQCDLIAKFSDFLNGCYLTVLIEVLQNGNKDKIRLRKSSAKIDLSKHNLYEEGLDDDGDGSNWLSLSMLISDIWHSYEFEPFQEKYDRLTKSLEFKAKDLLKEFILKHVLIRNCIQHHDWQLDAPSLKSIGKTKIEIATNDKPIEIMEWKTIHLTKEEIDSLFDVLKQFVTDFNDYVDKRVKTRYYRPKEMAKK